MKLTDRWTAVNVENFIAVVIEPFRKAIAIRFIKYISNVLKNYNPSPVHL